MKTKLLRKIRREYTLLKVTPVRGDCYYELTYLGITIKSSATFEEVLKTYHYHIESKYKSYISENANRTLILP